MARPDHILSIAASSPPTGRHRLHPRRFLAERPLVRRLAVNFAHLAGGNAAAAALNMVAFAVMARMLGPAMLGVFAMIESYATMVDQLVRLETWQPLIRYGALAIEEERRDLLRALVRLGVIVDVVGATAAATIALVAVPLAAALLHWSAQTAEMARWNCLTVLAGVSSTPIGILRLFDRFKRIAWLEPATALVRLALVGIVWRAGGTIWHLVTIFIAVQLLYRAALGLLAWGELRRHGIGGCLRAPLHPLGGIRRGYARLTLATNAAALVRKSTQEFDVLIVGGLAGPGAVGLYDLARRITIAAIKAGTMMQQIALPDLSRLWARRDAAGFRALIWQIEMMTAAAGFAFVALVAVGGHGIVIALAGDRFRDATMPLLIQSIAGCLFLCGSAVRPGLITIGAETRLLGIVLLAAVAFYVTLVLAVPRLGASGASAAHVAFNMVLLPLGAWAFASALRRAPHPSGAATATADALPSHG